MQSIPVTWSLMSSNHVIKFHVSIKFAHMSSSETTSNTSAADGHLCQSIFGAVICHPKLTAQCLLCGQPVVCTRDAFVHVPHLPSPYIAVCNGCVRDAPQPT